MWYDYNESAAIKMEMPPMMEQITFNEKGNLVAVFESNATKFKKIKKGQCDVLVANIEPVVKSRFLKIL